jgi:hypothetical protein
MGDIVVDRSLVLSRNVLIDVAALTFLSITGLEVINASIVRFLTFIFVGLSCGRMVCSLDNGDRAFNDNVASAGGVYPE